MFREVFYFIWWIYEGMRPVFYTGMLALAIVAVLTHVIAYKCGKRKQKKIDNDIISKLEEENSLGVNTSERVATQYDVLSGNYEEDDPIYN